MPLAPHTRRVTHLALVGYLVVVTGTFAGRVVEHELSSPKQVVAETPIRYGLASLLLAGLLIALVRGRRRWAWVVLVVATGFTLITSILQGGGALAFVGSLAGLALLASAPIRRHVSTGQAQGRRNDALSPPA